MTLTAAQPTVDTFEVECRLLTIERGALTLRRAALDALKAGREGVEVLDELEDALAALIRSVEALGYDVSAAWMAR